MLELSGAMRSVEHEQARSVTRLGRDLRDRIGRELVVEVIDAQSRGIHRVTSVAPGRTNRPGAIVWECDAQAKMPPGSNPCAK